jgi:hypothetical protein
MEAELSQDKSLAGRVFRRLERSFSRVFFAKAFLGGDLQRAAELGVPISVRDRLLYGSTILVILLRMLAYRLSSHLPILDKMSDRRLVARLKRQLAAYGHAEFTTNSAEYKPATAS